MALAHHPGPGVPERRDPADADREFAHHLVIVFLLAIPLLIAFWVGVMALAVDIAGVGYEAPLLMGAGIGLLAALFWGCWYAFVSYSDREEHERHRSGAAP